MWYHGDMTFRCPRCGGPYFGTVCRVESDPVPRVVIEAYVCHNDVDGGTDDRAAFVPGEGGKMRFVRPAKKSCGWRGPESECMVEVSR